MQTYTIKSGDTLRGIALKFYGDASKFVVIQEANDIANPNQISVGQVLEIPELADDNDNNPLKDFHRAFPNSVRWRLAEDGVEIEVAALSEPVVNRRLLLKFGIIFLMKLINGQNILMCQQ
ncbi:LysM peptidoglycan-binding domain-containing protein [Microcystis aeruginosa]|uniref:LysM domain-containing protein n=1 Tax=Microcystis aeruginosa SPC777 TaxID=482300 RepID=S3J5W6_MICAE|nr:LysM peptidoglycan-binding domain-containing protein [Microcystis aeruginosa]EPF21273.1 hypothetical protein MAESPC_02889 [Microcystis aeruginosa SPC777]